METIRTVIEQLLSSKLVVTLLVILCVALIRRLMLSRIRGEATLLTDKQRKWMSITKNGASVFLLLSVIIIWQQEISQFAFSVAAISVAIVVAAKEIILCFTGSIQRASSRAFRIGDWIEVGNLTGEVIEHNMMSTVIQEIDLPHGQYHYTGKTVTFPNSLFFTSPVKNLNFMKRYVFHNINIVIPDFANVFPLVGQLTERVHELQSDFIDVARRYHSVIQKHSGVDLPKVEPLIEVLTNASGDQVVQIMVFCPTEKARGLEQKIRHYFMDQYQALSVNAKK